jgi:hypothetical protein
MTDDERHLLLLLTQCILPLLPRIARDKSLALAELADRVNKATPHDDQT